MRMGFYCLFYDRVILVGFLIKVGNFLIVYFNNLWVFNSKRVIGIFCILNIYLRKVGFGIDVVNMCRRVIIDFIE